MSSSGRESKERTAAEIRPRSWLPLGGGDDVRREVERERVDADLRRHADAGREERPVGDEQAAHLVMLAGGPTTLVSGLSPMRSVPAGCAEVSG